MRTTWPISTKHDTKHPGLIQVYSNKGSCPFPRGDNYEITKYDVKTKKNLLFQMPMVNFNQTWYKASLGEGD